VSSGGYTSVSLPSEVVDRIDEFVEHEGKDWGYRSRPDVITDAVRRFIREWEQQDRLTEADENGGNNEANEAERRA
jgi:Arc/MetJ-type ribon-helix-helix transcriptional regulator